MKDNIFFLYKLPLPNDIIKIINSHLSYTKCKVCYKKIPIKNSKKCDNCNNSLCRKHFNLALNWGPYYTGINLFAMCSSCCWKEII